MGYLRKITDADNLQQDKLNLEIKLHRSNFNMKRVQQWVQCRLEGLRHERDRTYFNAFQRGGIVALKDLEEMLDNMDKHG